MLVKWHPISLEVLGGSYTLWVRNSVKKLMIAFKLYLIFVADQFEATHFIYFNFLNNFIMLGFTTIFIVLVSSFNVINFFRCATAHA
jgi:hypothetical protein